MAVVLIVALAALGVRAIPFGGPSASPGEAKSDKTAAPGHGAGSDRAAAKMAAGQQSPAFAQPLIDFYTTCAEKLPSPAGEDGPWPEFPDLPGWTMNYLIAVVPDPVESSSGYCFDAIVDAIQRALETEQFVLDRVYYPWPQPGDSPTGTATSPPVYDYTFHRNGLTRAPRETNSARPYEEQPGMLLFRGTPKQVETLGDAAALGRCVVVLLVGETATSGIQKKAFTASLDFVCRSKQGRDRDILVLGPHFSGSSPSLSRVIQNWASSRGPVGPPSFRVVSGAATAIDKPLFERECLPARVQYQATVIPDALVFRALLQHLRTGPQPERIAVLCESNTAYGRNLIHGDWKNLKSVDLVFFPFPMRISEVRAGYQKADDVTKNDLLRLPTFGGKIRLPLDEGSGLRDMEPTLHPSMAAVTNERALDGMLADLAHERFRYVAIAASDIRDKVFLATLVREYCPDVQLLLLSSDLILSHPDYAFYLRGALVASTYPLYLKNLDWTGDHSRRLLFSSEYEEGYYNATLALLPPDNPNSFLEYGHPFGRAFDEPSLQRDGSRPPIWISIIGQNGPQPVATETPDDLQMYSVFQAPNSHSLPKFSPRNTVFWLAPFLAFSLFVGIVAWSYALALRHHSRSAAGSEPGSSSGLVGLFWPRPAPLRSAQNFNVFICLAAVFVAYLYLVLVWDIPVLHSLRGTHVIEGFEWWSWIAPVGSFVLLLSLPALGIWGLVCMRRLQRADGTTALPVIDKRHIFGPGMLLTFWQFLKRNPLRPICFVLVSIMLAYLIYHWEAPRPHLLHSSSLFFFERATNLVSGVNPVVPVLLVALCFFWWGTRELKRIFLLDRHQEESPFPLQGEAFADINEAQTNSRRVLGEPESVAQGRFAWFVWLALLFMFCRLASRFVPTVEGVWFDSVLFLSLAVLALLVVRGLLHTFALWKCVRELLQAIAKLPMRQAYNRMPERITRSFGPYLSSVRPGRYTHLEERRKQFNTLCETCSSKAQLLQEALGCTESQWQELIPMKACAPLPQPDGIQRAAEQRETADWLRQAAQIWLRVLDRFWKNLTAHEVFGDPVPASSADSLAGASAERQSATPSRSQVQCWREAAEDFVALEVVSFLSQFFVQLRNMLLFLTVAPLLLLLAVTSYPFQPQRLWVLCAGALVLAVMVAAIKIFVQLERNELVSRISGTTPDRLNLHWSFLGNILTYTVPMLGVLAASSSDVSDLLRAYLEPIFRILR